jgi:SAM-dependent methyltransferase
MSDPVDLVHVAKLYEESLRKHGATPMGVGWRDVESHQVRFAKLAGVIRANSGSISVNDLGCGYGAFFDYLKRSGIAINKFRGYDMCEEMLNEARRLIQDPDVVEFVLGSRVDQPADYCFASGIFNVRLKASEDEWRQHVLETLDNLYEMSHQGMAFNLLTSYADWCEDHLFYGNPTFFFDYCKRRYSKYVALLHDYPLWEWTIHVLK